MRAVRFVWALFVLFVPSLGFPQYQYFVPEPKNPANIKSLEKGNEASPILWIGNGWIESSRLQEAAGWKGSNLPSEKEAEAIAKRLKDYYLSKGFLLAEVHPVRTDKSWHFLIDEGTLQGVYVYGAGWWDTYTLRTTLLPHDTFNQIHLEQQLQTWLQSHPTYAIRFEVEDKGGDQNAVWGVLEKDGGFLGDLRILTKVKKYSAHRLHIYVDPKGNIQKFGFGLGYTSAFGVQLEGRYTREALFTPEDRFLGSARVGLNRRDSIDPAKSGDNRFYSNSDLNLRWYTPPLSGKWLRLFVDTFLGNKIEQRPDLPLDSFRSIEEMATINVNFEPRRYKSLYVKLGQHLQHIFSVEEVPSDPFIPPSDNAQSLVFGAGLDMLFGKPRTNYTLNDILRATYDFYWRGGTELVRQTEAWYQKVWRRREGDYRLFTRGLWTMGGAQFFDEYSITRLGVHNSFNRKFYIQRGLNLTGEIRFNVWGDQFQVGLFNDAAIFGKIDHTLGTQDTKMADAVGPVIYAHFFDAFELSFNFASGFSNAGERSYEANIGFDKVF